MSQQIDENLLLENLALKCLINNSTIFDQVFLSEVFNQKSLIFSQSKFIKFLPKVNKFRFISKRHLYSFAYQKINKPDNNFSKGALRKIEDQVFLKQINFTPLLLENNNLNELGLRIEKIINPFVLEKKYELAANLRDKHFDILKNSVLDFWPNLDEIDFSQLRDLISE
jgi:hypothetical protein